eukprot:5544421-Pleurochrysis_carterae.AAC.2
MAARNAYAYMQHYRSTQQSRACSWLTTSKAIHTKVRSAQWEHAENDEFKQARKPTPKCRHTHKLARATNMQSLVRDDMHSHNEPHMNMLFIARVRAFALSQETARESRVLMTMRSTSVVC